jgi:hypothetical protein
MSKLQLLTQPGEWVDFKNRTEAQHGLMASQVQWGQGPAEYPCLVMPLVQPDKVICCYVYPDDATELINACGWLRHRVDQEQQAAPDQTVLPSQDEFNRKSMAHIMAVVHLLIDTGIVDAKRYEQEYLRQFARVEQVKEEQLREVASRVTKHAV